MRFLVIADIHAFSNSGPKAESMSWQEADAPESIITNPIAGIKEAVKGLEPIDVILFCGDLAHKADAKGLKFGWKSINELKELCSATLIPTIGNHDIKSRLEGENEYDPWQEIHKLAPQFPCQDKHRCDIFWARNYAIWHGENWRVVSLNSCAFHGYKKEHEYGRVEVRTLKDLESDLNDLESKKVNILLCHHHPQIHSELNLGDYDTMKNGQLLLDLLGTGKLGSWMVIHGHKHHPKITYASGGAFSPIVFSAGSVSAKLYEELQASARNQFYVIDFNLNAIQKRGEMVGRFQAWHWSHGIGWSEATKGSGLPSRGGFGNREIIATSEKLSRRVKKNEKANWVEIATTLPQIEWLTPSDLEQFIVYLKRHKRITCDDSYPAPIELVKS